MYKTDGWHGVDVRGKYETYLLSSIFLSYRILALEGILVILERAIFAGLYNFCQGSETISQW